MVNFIATYIKEIIIVILSILLFLGSRTIVKQRRFIRELQIGLISYLSHGIIRTIITSVEEPQGEKKND